MKIVGFKAENVKRLRAVEIRPGNKPLVQITGANGQGKSSVLDAIYMALAGGKAIPGKPVRDGEDHAMVRLDLGKIVVRRTFSAEGGTTLTVTADSGAKFPSPQRMLDDLMGSLTFDPLAFSRMDPKKQLQTLRGLVKIEEDIDALDAQNAVDFSARTEINRRAKEARARAAGIEVGIELPEQRVDLDDLLEQMAGAAEEVSFIERRRAKRREVEQSADKEEFNAASYAKEIQELTDKIATLEGLKRNAEVEAKSLRQKLADAAPLPEAPNTDKLRRQVDEGRRINAAFDALDRKNAEKEEAEQLEQQAENLTSAMAKRTKQRDDAISSAAMPVPGLDFGADGVIFNGIPFDQASSAEQLRVSVAIAMAANPELRVLRIKDGSLLDERSLAMISDMADEHDYQIWIEQVDTSGKIGIVMEDGVIAGTAEPVSTKPARKVAAKEIHAPEADTDDEVYP